MQANAECPCYNGKLNSRYGSVALVIVSGLLFLGAKYTKKSGESVLAPFTLIGHSSHPHTRAHPDGVQWTSARCWHWRPRAKAIGLVCRGTWLIVDAITQSGGRSVASGKESGGGTVNVRNWHTLPAVRRNYVQHIQNFQHNIQINKSRECRNITLITGRTDSEYPHRLARD